jgi:hypothetical protein
VTTHVASALRGLLAENVHVEASQVARLGLNRAEKFDTIVDLRANT